MARQKLVGSDVPAATTRKKSAKKKKPTPKKRAKKPAKKPAPAAPPAPKPDPPPAPKPDALSQVDTQLARSAVEKQRRGDTPTQREVTALRKVRRKQEEEARRVAYSAMPKGDYVRLSGRAAKVLNEQAERYGLPIGGREIDLAALLPAFHDLLAKNAHRIGGEDDDLLGGPNSDGLERYRHAKADLAEMELAAKRRESVDVSTARSGLTAIFEVLRQAGEQLRREFGSAAATILTDAVTDAAAQIQEQFGSDDSQG